MELTPKSYTNSSSSPRFPPAYCPHSTLTPPTYPTPPQSRANTEALPSHTPAMSGLGILNYGPPLPVTQVSICSSPQSSLQPTLSWPHDSPATTGYSNPSQEVGVYADHGIYDNYDTLSADMPSSFVMPNTHAEAVNMLAFLSPQLQQRRPGNPSAGCTPVLNNYGSNPQTPSIPRTRVTGTNRYGVFEDTGRSPMLRNNLKRSFAHIDGFSYESQPSALPPASGATRTTVSLAGSVESSGTQRQAQRSPLQSSHANTPLQANDTRSPSENPPKAKREKKGPPKFFCEVCNKRFTRNSNRSAHMKTHDPQRQRPNECTRPDCQMKFSRLTDLNRHIKSVHDNIKDHHCEKCGAPFSRRDTLRRHSGDACRRRQRRAQRLPTTLPPSTDSMQPFQQLPSSMEYREVTMPITQSQMQSPFFMTSWQ